MQYCYWLVTTFILYLASWSVQSMPMSHVCIQHILLHALALASDSWCWNSSTPSSGVRWFVIKGWALSTGCGQCSMYPLVLWHCWLGDWKGIWPIKTRATSSQRFCSLSVGIKRRKLADLRSLVKWPLKWRQLQVSRYIHHKCELCCTNIIMGFSFVICNTYLICDTVRTLFHASFHHRHQPLARVLYLC